MHEMQGDTRSFNRARIAATRISTATWALPALVFSSLRHRSGGRKACPLFADPSALKAMASTQAHRWQADHPYRREDVVLIKQNGYTFVLRCEHAGISGLQSPQIPIEDGVKGSDGYKGMNLTLTLLFRQGGKPDASRRFAQNQ
jgi:hypothetical protein